MWWYGSIIGVSLAHQLECQRTEMTCLHAASMMSTTDSNGRADRALKTVQWNMCVSSERQLMAIAPAYAGTVYCILFAWFGLRRFLHGMGSQLAPPKNDKPERETQ